MALTQNPWSALWKLYLILIYSTASTIKTEHDLHCYHFYVPQHKVYSERENEWTLYLKSLENVFEKET